MPAITDKSLVLPGDFVDRPTKPHKFIPSRTVGQCDGCIYPEGHAIHITERQLAVCQVVGTLLHPMKMMCVPDREKAYELCAKHNIMASELLDAARNVERVKFTIEG